MSEDRFCFDLCHVKTGTWIIAIIETILTIIGIANSARGASAWHGGRGSTTDEAFYGYVGQLVVLCIFLLLCILLMVALFKNRAGLVLPHLIVSVILVIWWIVNVVLVIVGGGKEIWAIIFFILYALFLISCIIIEWRCYKYLSALVY